MNNNREYPARCVFENDGLLRQMMCVGSVEPADWSILSMRREWVRQLIAANNGDKTR